MKPLRGYRLSYHELHVKYYRADYSDKSVIKYFRSKLVEGSWPSSDIAQTTAFAKPVRQAPRRRNRKFTVISPDILEADDYAKASFGMGHDGINFIERLAGFEG